MVEAVVLALAKKVDDLEHTCQALLKQKSSLSSSQLDARTTEECSLRSAVQEAMRAKHKASRTQKALLDVITAATLDGGAGMLGCHASIHDNMLDLIQPVDDGDHPVGLCSEDADAIQSLLTGPAFLSGKGLQSSQRFVRAQVRTKMTSANQNNSFFTQYHDFPESGGVHKVIAAADAKPPAKLPLDTQEDDEAQVTKVEGLLFHKRRYEEPLVETNTKAYISWYRQKETKGPKEILTKSEVERIQSANFAPHSDYMQASGSWTVNIAALVESSKTLSEEGKLSGTPLRSLFLACAKGWNAGLTTKHTACPGVALNLEQVEKMNFHTLHPSQLRRLLPMVAGAWLFLRVEQWSPPRIAWVVSKMVVPDEVLAAKGVLGLTSPTQVSDCDYVSADSDCDLGIDLLHLQCSQETSGAQERPPPDPQARSQRTTGGHKRPRQGPQARHQARRRKSAK